MSSQKPAYQRVLLKLSGEVLSGHTDQPLHQPTLARLVQEVCDVCAMGVQVAIVIGGGNICRGADWAQAGVDRVSADQIGMLSTVMNGIVLRDTFLQAGQAARLYSAIPMLPIAAGFQRQVADQDLSQGCVVILSGGTGNPLVTTDTAASLRGIELSADLICKATHVDGVYSDDPKQNKQAEMYARLSYQEAMEKRLKVMDLAAFQQCADHQKVLRVFNIEKPGALQKVVCGVNEGTLIE